MSLDKFYPYSQTIAAGGFGAALSLQVKMANHLKAAQLGDRDAESRLINRLGQVRRHYDDFDDVPENIRVVVREAVEWLRTTGRKVDFKSPNPALWISTRSGQPRW